MFDTVPLVAFRMLLLEEPLKDLAATSESIGALREATSRKDLEGAARLVKVHHNLVELLEYLESREGFSLFPGGRKKATTRVAQD